MAAREATRARLTDLLNQIQCELPYRLQPIATYLPRPRSPMSPDEDLDVLSDIREEVEADPKARAMYEDTLARALLLRKAKRVRRQRRLSQRDVANDMGTTQSAVSDIESGRVEPQLQTLQRFARAIGRRLDVAFVDEGRPSTVNELWNEVEKTTLSPLLTALATRKEGDSRQRTLDVLAEAIPMPASIVRFILDNLLAHGWATIEGQVYSLKDDAVRAVGVSLNHERIVGVLVDLKGEVHHEISVRPPDTTASTIVECAAELVEQLVGSRGADQYAHRIVGVGVSVAGVVESDSGRVRFEPDLQSDDDDWYGIDLEEQLQEEIQSRLGDPTLLVVVENDANALAVQEYLQRSDPSIIIILLTEAGIGCGLVVGGNLVHGAHSAAGEGGHTIIDPTGPECRSGFGHKGCLETLASARGILNTLLPEQHSIPLDEGLAIVNDQIRKQDRQAADVFESAGAYLGHFLGITNSLIDPSRVALYGHREISDTAYPSAVAYQNGVQRCLDQTLASSEEPSARSDTGVTTTRWIADSPRLEWHELKENTLAKAAGSVAVMHFLARPAEWASEILPRAADGELINA